MQVLYLNVFVLRSSKEAFIHFMLENTKGQNWGHCLVRIIWWKIPTSGTLLMFLRFTQAFISTFHGVLLKQLCDIIVGRSKMHTLILGVKFCSTTVIFLINYLCKIDVRCPAQSCYLIFGERAAHWTWGIAIRLVNLAACTRNLTGSASPVLELESLLAIPVFPFHTKSLHVCTARVLLTELRPFLSEFYEILVNIKTPWTVSLGGKKEEKNGSSKILKRAIASVFEDINSA